MAKQTVEFSYSIGEKITVIETGRDGWVKSLHLGADNVRQYYVATTASSGEPIDPAWKFETQIAASGEPVEDPPVLPVQVPAEFDPALIGTQAP
jgi:hypothetical protein